MIPAIIVDDELYSLEEICDRVENTGLFHICGQYQNPLEALRELSHTRPSVAFIDIEMPEINGITLAEKILENDPSVIIVFITSWNQYAVQAFDVNAFDYILKPIKAERFSRMIEKVQSELLQNTHPIPRSIEIQCFGTFEVYIDKKPVGWERAKAEELFAFLLIHHDHYIHKECIIEHLWPNYSPDKALPILQTSVCRIRKVFSKMTDKICLKYKSNRYCMLINNIACDYLEFVDFLGKENPYPAQIKSFAARLEQGLFADQGYLWSLEKEAHLRNRMMSLYPDD